jgi:DNA-directed RNA polymerase specialized sigma24 family protein
MMAALRDCVRELPEGLRRLCELLFERGLKQTQAATELKMSTPTVTRRKQEACDRLRRCMRRKGILQEVFN